MDSKQALRASMEMSDFVLGAYISDLSDDDLMRRPGPGCNHLAWQLGHLISSEISLLESVCPGAAAGLPDGFADKHNKEATGNDNAQDFCTLSEYKQLQATVRQATLAALEALPEDKLDDPSPENMRDYFPTVGHMFALIGSHPMMHAGQFAVVRRQAGKPVVV